MILIWDTETTGLIKKWLPAGHPDQPYLVQLGCLLISDTGREVCSADLIVRPQGWAIPEGAARVHGITTEIATEVGVPLATVLSVFAQLRQNAQEVVAFNEEFDSFIMRTAFSRHGKNPSHSGPDKITCAMRLASDIMKLPPTAKMVAAGFDKHKPPNLQEAYKFFVNDKGFEGAHSAVVDCRATAEVLMEIRRRERATSKEVPF